MTLNEWTTRTGELPSTEHVPVLFVGHGSPMNAIEENEFNRGWQALGRRLPRPRAILCISAHWQTRGTHVTAMARPRTIHDFGGFPRELYEVQYPAPGDPDLAGETKRLVTAADVGLDHTWGLDHGCWSVVKHLYPAADVPVMQMSLDHTRPPHYHYELAQQLSFLRKRGVLIIGSGNVVHNLGVMDWDNERGGFDWAVEANSLIQQLIVQRDHSRLIHYASLGRAMQLAVPTPEHFLPLLYVLGLQGSDESITFSNERVILGSISMVCLEVGPLLPSLRT
jgi:4,5-DOPA dioxygenase extradiol